MPSLGRQRWTTDDACFYETASIDPHHGIGMKQTLEIIPFTLIVDNNTLRPNKNLPFMKRTDLFQRCGSVAQEAPPP